MGQHETSQDTRPSILDGYPVGTPEELESHVNAVMDAARGQVGNLSFESILSFAPEIKNIIGQLMLQAMRSAHTQKLMAEAKSLRQPDNPEQRTDLYSHQKASDTIEGRAAALLGIMLARIERTQDGA